MYCDKQERNQASQQPKQTKKKKNTQWKMQNDMTVDLRSKNTIKDSDRSCFE